MEPYDSFFVRCWVVEDEAEREHSVFEIEHIQTGARECVATLEEVQVWIKEKLKAAGSDSEGAVEQVSGGSRDHDTSPASGER